MKKFTFFMTMFIAFAMTAFAQVDTGKAYRIKSKSVGNYLTIGESNANTHGHVHGAALDESNQNQVFNFIAVEDQASTYYVQSVSGKYISYEGAGAGWNVNANSDVAMAHALTFEAAADVNEFYISCWNQSKGGTKYFKYENVGASGKYHPFNDADKGAAEVWVLEAVETEAPEPELPEQPEANVVYSLTETRLTSSELNSKTEPTLIAIKNLSKTNNYWFVGNTGAVPYSVAEFSEDAVFVWEPVVEGVAGMYCLKKLDGTYMTSASPTTFSSENGSGAIFSTTNPTTDNGGFNGDGDTQYDDQSWFVRFVTGGQWINVQNGDAGTPVYNNGTGGWTLHNVYLVEEKEATVEPEPEPEPEQPVSNLILDLTAEQVGTSYPYQLSDEDAAKVYALSDITIAVRFNTTSLSGRKALFATADPTKVANTDAMGTNSYYVAYGMNNTDLGYLASWKDGDRYTAGQCIPSNTEGNVAVYVINPTNNKFRSYINGQNIADRNFGTYEIASPAMVKADYPDANIYIGGAMNASGAGEVFNGQITGVKVFNGALSAEEIAAITFDAVEPEPEPEPDPAGPVVITSVDQLSNAKLYTITSSDTGRGNFYALGSKIDMCGVTYNAGSDACHQVAYNAEDPKQQFAFVAYEGQHYLYSVSEKMFIAKNGDVNKLTAEAPYEFVVVEPVSENTFALMLNGTHYMTASPGWCANPNRATCIQTTLTNHNSDNGWDNGAWYTITEVGEFDATEALAMLAPAEPELPALEVTGYTPTEAVEKLETITITFNDEIEGTFDMMAMSQIYLGSRSNGCSFAVEGNVLTITPFNAITTPGEYGLVIPEGLITRKANGEKISLNKEITFTVKEAIAALEITGYTPTETVEKLETITITFNDEIEGTFDMMAMSQIYLGSRSNGCSFAVEGNVLTITPFNAITTPGEYGLVIPEGLITRKATGEAVTMNGEIVFTVKEAVVEPEPAATVAIYHITAKDAARGALYATAESTHLTHCGATYGHYHNQNIAANAEDINQQFIFVEYEGKSYMYSLGAKKFAVKESQYIKLVENPEGFVTVVDTEAEGYKYIMFNGQNRLNFSGGYDHGCVANYETPDDGNHLALTEVGQYDATELVAYIEAYFKAEAEALAAARAAFDAKYAEAEAILAEAELSVTENELPLQVADANAAAYVWCNNPDPGEGPIAQLVDGIAQDGNFFHTSWRGGGEEPHYIEVDLGEGNELDAFSFKYTTRFAVANDYPDAIQVLGSNDKEAYTELYNVTSGLPQTGGTEWASNIISSETAYRYLRFVVTAERIYWHMSEFDIITSKVSVADKYAAVANTVYALDNAFKAAADNAEYTAEELNAAVEALNAAIETINAGIAEPSAPLQVVAVTPSEAVESLQTITIEFDSEIAIDEANINACTIDYLGWNVIIGTTASVEGNVLKLVAFSAIKDKGTHYLTIPAGVVTRASDGVAYEGGKFTFEVKEKTVEPLAAVKVTPEAEVRTLDVITIEFNRDVYVNTMTSTAVVTIANDDKSINVTINATDIQYEGKVVTFDLGENAITTSGEYTLDIPSGIIVATDGTKYSGTHTFTVVAPETFVVSAYLFPTPQGDVREISAIRVEAGQGPSLADLPTDWTFTNEDGDEIEMDIQWMYDFEEIFISFNPAITEAGTYTLTIPAGSLKTDDGKECEAATFQFTVVAPTLVVTSIDPAEGEVTEIASIKINFNEEVEVKSYFEFGGRTFMNISFNKKEAMYVAMDEEGANEYPITEAGEYVFELSMITDAEFAEGQQTSYTWTIVDTTGIDGIDAEAEQTIYDLQGRKVDTITKGGIYIINGKKVLVK